MIFPHLTCVLFPVFSLLTHLPFFPFSRPGTPSFWIFLLTLSFLYLPACPPPLPPFTVAGFPLYVSTYDFGSLQDTATSVVPFALDRPLPRPPVPTQCFVLPLEATCTRDLIDLSATATPPNYHGQSNSRTPGHVNNHSSFSFFIPLLTFPPRPEGPLFLVPSRLTGKPHAQPSPRLKPGDSFLIVISYFVTV